MDELSPINGHTFGEHPGDDNSPPDAPRRSGVQKRARKRGPRRNTKPAPPKEASVPGPGTMYRTKKLLAAAIRVWELRRGLRD